LAIIFGLIGLAVHVLFIVAIVVMAVLFALMASELRGKRSGSVASVVVASAVAEAKVSLRIGQATEPTAKSVKQVMARADPVLQTDNPHIVRTR
jgi:hypothetical protein